MRIMRTMKIVRIIMRKMRKFKFKMTVTMVMNKTMDMMMTEIMRINELLWSHYVALCCKELLTYAATKHKKLEEKRDPGVRRRGISSQSVTADLLWPHASVFVGTAARHISIWLISCFV